LSLELDEIVNQNSNTNNKVSVVIETTAGGKEALQTYVRQKGLLLPELI
jgi:hypothetical protein